MEKKNNLDPQYNNLLKDILENGVKKQTRNGEVLSIFGKQIKHKMSDGFPLLTGKKMFFKGIVTELLWFLRGDTNIKYLVDNGCHIWDGDAYKNYTNSLFYNFSGEVKGYVVHEHLSQEEFINKIKTDNEFAKKWGELGPVYGRQWREWSNYRRVDSVDEVWSDYRKDDSIDQITNLINELKTNPDSRRLMVNAWNVGELDQMVLPPCHYGFQVYTRELSYKEKVKEARKRFGFELEDGTRTFDINTEEAIKFLTSTQRAISLMWNQRSVDTFLGLPFNIASYGLLLEIIAKEVNMVPDELIGNLGDVHLYTNHIEQAKEQIGRELTLEERTELAKGKIVPLLGSKEDAYDEAGIPKRTREPYPLPTLKFEKNILENIFLQETVGRDKYNVVRPEDFTLENYQSHPAIKAPLSN